MICDRPFLNRIKCFGEYRVNRDFQDPLLAIQILLSGVLEANKSGLQRDFMAKVRRKLTVWLNFFGFMSEIRGQKWDVFEFFRVL